MSILLAAIRHTVTSIHYYSLVFFWAFFKAQLQYKGGQLNIIVLFVVLFHYTRNVANVKKRNTVKGGGGWGGYKVTFVDAQQMTKVQGWFVT